MSFDRLILPRQSHVSREFQHLLLSNPNSCNEESINHRPPYHDFLAEALFGLSNADIENRRILRNRIVPIPPSDTLIPRQKKLPILPLVVNNCKTCEVPGILNNVYNSPLSISEDHHIVCGSRGDALFIASSSNEPIKLGNFTATISGSSYENMITSTLFTSRTACMFGTHHSNFFKLDLSKERLVDDYALNAGPINIIAKQDEHCAYLGCYNGTLFGYDSRIGITSEMTPSPHQQISSLTVDKNIAVGSNDDLIRIYDTRNHSVHQTLEGHRSAVTGLAWYDPSHLVSTGGVYDKTIRVWCTIDKKELSCVDTGSQVTSIQKINRDTFVTTHGECADQNNRIQLWKLGRDGIKKIQTVSTPHIPRALFSSYSNQKLVTASHDYENPGNGAIGPGLICAWEIQSSGRKTPPSPLLQSPIIR